MNLQTPILIVDADEQKCVNVIRILTNADYELFHADNFDDAMKLTATRKPRLVIIAIRENSDFGVEVCRLIRTEKVYFGTVILQISPENMLTAEGSSHAPDCEPDAYLAENCKPRELVSIAKTLLRFHVTEKETLQQQQNLDSILSSTGIGVWHLDLLNQTAQRSIVHDNIFGYEELLPEWTYQKFLDHVLPEHREMVDESFGAAMQNGGDWDIEAQIKRRDGEIRWIWARGQSQNGENNNESVMLGTVIDITSRKNAEQEISRLNQTLQNRVDELQTLLDVVPVGVAIAEDASAKKVYANRYLKNLLEVPTDSNISSIAPENEQLPWTLHRNGKEINGDNLPIQLSISTAQTVKDYEFEAFLPHYKEPISFIGSAAPLFDKNGEVRGSIGAFVDNSERKKYELELESLLAKAEISSAEAIFANKAKDEFLAVLSHELRTPLNAMYGWVRMLSGGQLDEKATKRAIEVIERNIQLQTKLIEDILDVSRIISGKIKLELHNFDLVALVNSIVELSRPTASMKRIEIETTSNVENLQFYGDSERLQQVFSNLINNAIKFTPSNGKISIAVEKKFGEVEITVADDGIGINADFLLNVFDRFKQADGTTTRKHGGLGLGLAIVKHLTELHEGTVSAESEGENKGATFKITLPLENENQRGTTDFAIHVSSGQAQMQNLHVLIVEDDGDAREMLRVVLETEGATVFDAKTGIEALKVLTEQKPNIIISDIGMPEMDGLQLVKSLRSDENLKEIPAIALTAYASVEAREQILQTGFDDCLAKPIDFEGLKTAINRVIKKKRQP